jgi:RNA polymerase sigma-70 factor (ECF subfamily)
MIRGGSTIATMTDRPRETRDQGFLRRRRWRDTQGASDEALVAGMAASDPRAGEVFVRRHQRRVYGIALAITSNPSTAQDVAQEAFLRAWRHAAIFDPRRAAATAWLATITRNLAIDALRLQRSVPVDPDDPVWAGTATEDGVTESSALRSDSVERVRAALRALPEEQRRALVRSAFYGQSATEIAEVESIAVGTAKSRIRLGLAKVRGTLDEEGR